MKRVLAATVAALALIGFANPALAQFGSLLNVVKNRGVSGSALDVDGVLVRARDAELLTRRSADGIYAAVESQGKVADIEAKRKANAAILDPKEREAAERKLDAEVDATLASVDWDAEQKQLQTEESSARTKHLGVSLYNFALAVLRDQQVVTSGKEISTAIASNPIAGISMMGKLGEVKDATFAVSSQVGNLGRIATGIPKLMTVAKVTELPASASAAPKEAAD